MIDKLPIPPCDMAHPLKLNEAIAWLIPKSAKLFDKYLSKLQMFIMDAMGPITWLWDQMQQGTVDNESTKKCPLL